MTERMKILDIGCGEGKKYKSPGNNVIGIDKMSTPGVDVVHDIEKGLPFKDNEFDYVYTSHTLEHISNLDLVMKEIWRVAKPGALVEIIVPYWSFAGAVTNPDHKRVFTYNTFVYYSNKWEFCPKDAKFGIVKRELRLYPERYFEDLKGRKNFEGSLAIYSKICSFISKIFGPIINKYPDFYQSTFLVYLFPAREVRSVLKVMK